MNRTPFQLLAAGYFGLAAMLTLALGQPVTSNAWPKLDYDYFKAKVEPVFLAKRDGHTRCVVCHTVNNAPLHLVPPSPGATSWNDEESRRNIPPGPEGGRTRLGGQQADLPSACRRGWRRFASRRRPARFPK
jgi:hypothetical protein